MGRSAASRSLQENNIFVLGRHDEDTSLLQQRDVDLNRGDKDDVMYQESGFVSQQDSNGDSMENDNVFERRGDATAQLEENASARRIQTANATAFLNVQPSIRACECDGITCTTVNQVKHVGDPVTICLFSNFLSIAEVSNMTLHVDGEFTHPVVNGTANELTEVEIHGKLAVVTTMTISAFYQHPNPSDLEVDATVSFVSLGDGNTRRRHLHADIVGYPLNNQRLLQTTTYIGRSSVVVGWVCLFSAILVITVEISLFMSKRTSTKSQHDDESHTEDNCDIRNSNVMNT